MLAPRRDASTSLPPHLELTTLLGAGRARPPLRARQAFDRAAAPGLRAGPDDLLGLPLEDPAGGARRPSARLDQPAPGAAAAPPRADPARVGVARRGSRLGHDVAPHGRRARHRQHPRAGLGPDRGRRRRHRAVRAKLLASAVELLPRALERVAAGDPGDPQPERERAGPGTSRTTNTSTSTGRSRPATSTTRCAPGTSSSASPGSGALRPSSTGSRSCSGRRG